MYFLHLHHIIKLFGPFINLMCDSFLFCDWVTDHLNNLWLGEVSPPNVFAQCLTISRPLSPLFYIFNISYFLFFEKKKYMMLFNELSIDIFHILCKYFNPQKSCAKSATPPWTFCEKALINDQSKFVNGPLLILISLCISR